MTIAATTRTPSGSNSRISAATLITWSPGSRGWLVDSSSSGSRKPTAGRKASTRISRTGSRARQLAALLEAIGDVGDARQETPDLDLTAEALNLEY